MWKNSTSISRKFSLLGIFLCTCLMSGFANASKVDFDSGWPRFDLNSMKIKNSGTKKGAAHKLAKKYGIRLLDKDSSFFVSNRKSKIKWQGQDHGKNKTLKHASALVWAEIDTSVSAELDPQLFAAE